MVDANIKDILQSAVSSIESTKNLKMNLHPDVNLEKIFANSIIYEYQEGNNNIPESQFWHGVYKFDGNLSQKLLIILSYTVRKILMVQ